MWNITTSNAERQPQRLDLRSEAPPRYGVLDHNICWLPPSLDRLRNAKAKRGTGKVNKIERIDWTVKAAISTVPTANDEVPAGDPCAMCGVQRAFAAWSRKASHNRLRPHTRTVAVGFSGSEIGCTCTRRNGSRVVQIERRDGDDQYFSAADAQLLH